MTTLPVSTASFLTWFLTAWLAALAGMVVLRLVSGAIATAGMLSHNGGPKVDPERVQLLIAAFLTAAYYARLAMAHGRDADLASIPDIPSDMLAVVIGSQFLFLGGKLGRRLNARGP